MATKTIKPTGRICVSCNGLSFTGSTKLAYDLWTRIGDLTDAGPHVERFYEALTDALKVEGIVDALGVVIREPEL